MNIRFRVGVYFRKIHLTILYIINRLLVLIEFFLFLRLILKFLGANPKSLVVNFIYLYSDILVSPFDFIFPNIYWSQGYLIETATISAIIGYILIAFFIFQILDIFFRD